MDVVGSVKSYLFKKDSATTDNITFKLHYRVSFSILLGCMLLVSARQYIGEPISCIVDGVPSGTMDLYCWIHATFSVPSRWGKGSEEYGEGNPATIGTGPNPHPGVAPPQAGEDVVYHKYYQWVVFVLFLQALCFHLPRLFWKHTEGGIVKMLVGDLTNPMYIVNKDDRKDRIELIAKYFKENTKGHGGYALNFFLAEILCLINVISQIYFTDRFLGYQFTTYGWDVFTLNNMNPEDRPDPMNVVFPKVTKCTFFKYGTSGTIENRDGLCILALNIINEKVYLFLWFWFVGVAIFSAVALIYRILVVLVPSIRVQVLMTNTLYQVDRKLIQRCLSCPTHNFLDQVGDYWILFLLSRNLSPIAMRELFEDLGPVMNPEQNHYGYPNNFDPKYPTFDEKEFEKESQM